jgi:hypothetical protein
LQRGTTFANIQTTTYRQNLEHIHMNYGKEFKSLLQSKGVNAMYYDKIVAAMNPTNMTPIHRRAPLNISH